MHLRIQHVFQKGEMLACHDAPGTGNLAGPAHANIDWDDWIGAIATVWPKAATAPENFAAPNRPL